LDGQNRAKTAVDGRSWVVVLTVSSKQAKRGSAKYESIRVRAVVFSGV